MTGPEPARMPQAWRLSAEAFDRLLRALDTDRERAGERYERIRAKLAKLFEWRGCLDSQDLADATMDRVARRLEDGVELHTSDPYAYFHGVALRVMQEHWRARARAPQALEVVAGGLPAVPDPTPEETPTWRLDCLRECLDKLPPESRQLLEQYHQGEKGARIRARKEMAGALRIPPAALRLRAFRIRAALAACIEGCEGRRR